VIAPHRHRETGEQKRERPDSSKCGNAQEYEEQVTQYAEEDKPPVFWSGRGSLESRVFAQPGANRSHEIHYLLHFGVFSLAREKFSSPYTATIVVFGFTSHNVHEFANQRKLSVSLTTIPRQGGNGEPGGAISIGKVDARRALVGGFGCTSAADVYLPAVGDV
jgi:hypothetical protein